MITKAADLTNCDSLYTVYRVRRLFTMRHTISGLPNNCVFCEELISQLKENGLSFAKKNINSKEAMKELNQLNPNGGIPTTLVQKNNVLSIVVGSDFETVTGLADWDKKISQSKLNTEPGVEENITPFAGEYPTDNDGNRLCSSYGYVQKKSRQCCISDTLCRGCFKGNTLQHCFRTN